MIVVNTCSFIASAQQESVNTILEMAKHKTDGPRPKAGGRRLPGGTLPQRDSQNIPEVDAVVGTGELEDILAAAGVGSRAGRSILRSAFCNRAPKAMPAPRRAAFRARAWDGAIADLPNYLYDEATPRVLATPRHTAYIKIAEGCDHPCTFCIIPQLRGQFRSRRFESVIAEAERLARSGVREITLIGQDTTCYGEDFGLKDGLALLLEKLAGIEDLRWVRFLYAYPNKITGRLLETIAAHEKICSYIDVPLQHASPSVLKRMKRGGARDIFLRSIEKMRRTIPGVTLRTSFIVGFPGETEKEFEELCQFVRDSEFDWMGAFGYSDQEGAGAFARGKEVARARNRTPPQTSDGNPAQDQQAEEESAGGPGIRSAARRHLGGNRSPARRPHPDARAGNRRQSIRQRRSRRAGAEDRRVLPLPDHRGPRLRSGGPDLCRNVRTWLASAIQAEVPHLQEAGDQQGCGVSLSAAIAAA